MFYKKKITVIFVLKFPAGITVSHPQKTEAPGFGDAAKI